MNAKTNPAVVAALSVLLSVLASGAVALAEDSEGHGGHAIPGHHIEAMLGAAYHDDELGSYTGLEYEYRFSRLFGAGAFADTTFDGFDLFALGAVANFHPAGGWKVMTGVGLERRLDGGKDKALFRVGGGYEFEVGNGTIAPVITYDFLEDTHDVVYLGVALGFSF